MATNLKLSKAQIKKMIQSGGILGKLLSKLAGPLMKVAMPLAKNMLAPLGLTAAMSAIGSTKLIIENEDMNDIMKITEALENSGILLKGVSKAIENKAKEQKRGFLSMLLGTLVTSLLGNLLSDGKRIVRAGEGIVRAGAGAKKKKQKFNLMLFLPLTNFEISEFYKNEPRFNGVYSQEIICQKQFKKVHT